MNKLNTDIDKDRKIITIDILGNMNKDNVSSYITQLNTQIERLIQIQQVNISELRFNIYTCHMIINKEELESIKELLDYCTSCNFKMIDVITAKPQKKYREWMSNIIQKYFSDYHIKTLATNNMFKF